MTAKAKILIVDDDSQFAGHLRSAGYPSVTAVDAVQGFMFAQREQPALILLDLNMPAGGGLTLLERLIKSVRTQMIPILVLTARAEPEIEAQVRAQGAVGFLHKPITRDTLIAEIESALSRA